MFEQRINIDRMEQAVALFGSFDENVKLIEQVYGVKIVGRDSEIKVSGEPESVAKAVKTIESLLTLINRGEALSEQNVRYCISMVNEGSGEKIETLAGDCICVTSKGKPVKPKTFGQKKYCNTIKMCIRDRYMVLLSQKQQNWKTIWREWKKPKNVTIISLVANWVILQL